MIKIQQQQLKQVLNYNTKIQIRMSNKIKFMEWRMNTQYNNNKEWRAWRYGPFM